MAKDWCNEKDATNKKVLDFIHEHLDEAEEISKELDIPVEWILGLSGTECGYGTSKIARNAKNFFGLNAHASGRIGTYLTDKKVLVAKFKDFKSSANSFAKDFGILVRRKKTPLDFVKSLIPKFNTADPKTNGNPAFIEDTIGGIESIKNRIICKQLQPSHKCGAACGDFEKYGYCDRSTKSTYCWQHSS